MAGYRMDVCTAEQLAAEDPFEGRGLFLALQEKAEVILRALEDTFGIVAAVAWPGRGVWVDTRALDVSKDEALARWNVR